MTGRSPELIVALVLHRVRAGGVLTVGGGYLDDGLLAPGSLTGTFDELLDTGLLALVDLAYAHAAAGDRDAALAYARKARRLTAQIRSDRQQRRLNRLVLPGSGTTT